MVASADGTAGIDARTPPGEYGVPFTEVGELPACLLDAYEVHIVLAYHPDRQTCGSNPCGETDFIEQVAWMFVAGEGQ